MSLPLESVSPNSQLITMARCIMTLTTFWIHHSFTIFIHGQSPRANRSPVLSFMTVVYNIVSCLIVVGRRRLRRRRCTVLHTSTRTFFQDFVGDLRVINEYNFHKSLNGNIRRDRACDAWEET